MLTKQENLIWIGESLQINKERNILVVQIYRKAKRFKNWNDKYFNQVFGKLNVNEPTEWIEQSDFEEKIGIVVTKDLLTCDCIDLKINSLRKENDEFILNYTQPEYSSEGIEYCDIICRPYILILVERNSFSTIDFVENNNVIKSLVK